MKRTTKIFISYKTGADDGLTYTANSLRRELERLGYTVWMDDTNLEGGKDWTRQIYDNIRDSDILLMLLGNTTANSEWVLREVDFAKGANVTVLPILIRDKFDKQEAMNRFDLPRVQYIDLKNGTDEQFKRLLVTIEKCERETLERQTKWLEQRTKDSRGTPHKPARKRYGVYRLELKNETEEEMDSPETEVLSKIPTTNGRKNKLVKREEHICKIYLAVGTIIRLTNIDVLVNSENDYMQMARIFESKTISALLRHYGSNIDEGGRLIEDTVQEELNQQLRGSEDLPLRKTELLRPVGTGTVIVTSAGHPDGHLMRRNKARYIFHTAAVSVEGEGTEKRLEPMRDNSSIRRATMNTLEKVEQVNKYYGIISPKSSAQGEHQRQEAGVTTATTFDEEMTQAREAQISKAEKNYKPIKSIVLPLFASGHGGRLPREVIPAILDGIKDYLEDHRTPNDTSLREIYLCAYYDEDIDMMRAELKREFKEESWLPNED